MAEQNMKPESGAAAGNGRARRSVFIAIMLLVVMAVGAFCYWFFFMRPYVKSDDARFDGHMVDLIPEVTGTLQDVLVHEGQVVKKGDGLFQIDPGTFKASLAQDEAAVASAKSSLAAAKAQYDRALNGPRAEELTAARAVSARSEAALTLAAQNRDRVEKLFKSGATAQDELDSARASYDAAHAAHAADAANLALLESGTRAEDIASAAAAVEAAKGKVAEDEASAAKARLDLGRTTVVAPFDGPVVRKWLDPGAMVQPGQPVVTMFDPATIRVMANIEEKYLHSVEIGDKVDVDVDSFPSLKLEGRVKEILRAVNSEFSLIPSEGVSGTFIKVTQRVPLWIEVEVPKDLPIGPGLSVEVRIHVGSAEKS